MIMDTKLNTTEILKDFHKITGARISLHNLDFDEIAGYPEKISVFCSAVQKNPGVYKRCVDADITAFESVKKSGEVYVYKCHCGLIEIVAPIYNYGILSGYVIMGQITDSKQESINTIKEKSISYFSDPDEFEAALKTVPVIGKSKIGSYVNILQLIAEYMTQTNRVLPKSTDLATGVHRYINQNFSKKLNIEMMCDIFGCSRTTLMNSFKERYDITIGEYINECRLLKAEKLLSKTDDSIKKVSSECGFSDQNYFSKVFYRKFNCTPTLYRKKQIESND